MDLSKSSQNNTLKKPTLNSIESTETQLFLCCFFVPGGDPKHRFGFLVSRRGLFFLGLAWRLGFGSVERKVWHSLSVGYVASRQPSFWWAGGFGGFKSSFLTWKTKYRNRNLNLTFSQSEWIVLGANNKNFEKNLQLPEFLSAVHWSCRVILFFSWFRRGFLFPSQKSIDPGKKKIIDSKVVTGKRDYVFKSSQEGKDFPASNLSISLPAHDLDVFLGKISQLHVMLSDVLPGGSVFRFSEATYFSFVFFEKQEDWCPYFKKK